MVETKYKRLFSRARVYIPGGVNSPVRSFKSVGGYPIFIKKASGAYIYGEYREKFIDYCLSWGVLILGHAHKEVIRTVQSSLRNGTSFGTATRLEIELAKLIVDAVPSIEQVRLTNSGTEAVMGAIRLARAYTKRDKIIRFRGSYHGHADYLLNGRGVPHNFLTYTITVPYNDIEALEDAACRYRDDLAAIIVEPVAGNCGVVVPRLDFLKKLREVTDRFNIVLIFDEVITGFRISYGGAQEMFGIKPDLTCLGKIIGGGLPVGAFGGKRKIMNLLAPEGDVFQAGTLSGNPVAVSAGIATLKILRKRNPYKELESKTNRLCEGIRLSAEQRGVKLKVSHIGSMFSIFFGEEGQDVNLFNGFFHRLLEEGIYFSPSAGEADFLSTAHSCEDIDMTIGAIDRIFKNIRRKG